MALSKNFPWPYVFSRAEMFCNEVEKNLVSPESLLQMIKRKMVEVTSIGGIAFDQFYTTEIPKAVTYTNGIGVIDLDDTSLREILGVSVQGVDLAQLSAGDDGAFVEVFSKEALLRSRKNKERNKNGRLFYKMLGNDKPELYVYVGDNISEGKANVYVTIRRIPDINIDLDTARDDETKFIDIPDFLVSYVEYGSAIDALKQAGAKANQQFSKLENNYQAFVESFDKKQQEQEKILRNQSADH